MFFIILFDGDKSENVWSQVYEILYVQGLIMWLGPHVTSFVITNMTIFKSFDFISNKFNVYKFSA
jgi:hypothetical protein